MRIALGHPLAVFLCIISPSSFAALPGTYQGWTADSGVISTPGFKLTEEYCGAQDNLTIDGGLNWTSALIGEVCWGRETFSNARNYWNYDPNTGLHLTAEDFDDRSTRPLVSAGGNLKVIYGEEVENGIGDGEERFGTLLSTPSDDSLLIVTAHEYLVEDGTEEDFGGGAIFVKSTAAIKNARTASDLAGTDWHIGYLWREMFKANPGLPNVEFGATGVYSVSLLANGVCTYTLNDSIPATIGQGETPNAIYYSNVQVYGADNLGDAGVQVSIEQRERSNCTYSIDGDKYLAISFDEDTVPAGSSSVPRNFRMVVSDDNRYLALAPRANPLEGAPAIQWLGYRAATQLAESEIDGTYLMNFMVQEFESTGSLSGQQFSGFWQQYDEHGRGMFTFNSEIDGEVPANETGDWYSCDAQFVSNFYDLAFTGEISQNTVQHSTEAGSDTFDFTTCDFQLDVVDGELKVHVTSFDPEDPEDSFAGTFRGYVNDNGEVMSLVYAEGDPDLTDDQDYEESGDIIFFYGMRYIGHPLADADGNGLTNLEEFQFPLPPKNAGFLPAVYELLLGGD